MQILEAMHRAKRDLIVYNRQTLYVIYDRNHPAADRHYRYNVRDSWEVVSDDRNVKFMLYRSKGKTKVKRAHV